FSILDHSDSTYITDNRFVEKDQALNNEFFKPRYIFKQNGMVNGDKINFSNEELEIDGEKDNLPTEEDALKTFFG
ncbi:14742_t:CDS:1, partial [Gigaspora rosea]